MKAARRQLESRWWKTLLDQNLAFVNKLSSKYASTIRAVKKIIYCKVISEASNQQAELFQVVHFFAETGLKRLQPNIYTYDRFTDFQELEYAHSTNTIYCSLDIYLTTAGSCFCTKGFGICYLFCCKFIIIR